MKSILLTLLLSAGSILAQKTIVTPINGTGGTTINNYYTSTNLTDSGTDVLVKGGVRVISVTATNGVTAGSGGSSNSVDSVILISRAVNDDVAGNGHAFSDSSDVTRSGGVAYNSFDARTIIGGTNSYNHYAAFQSGPILTTSGVITNLYELYAHPLLTNGAVGTRYGIYIDDVSVNSPGSLTNNYGIYVANLANGSGNKFSFYGAGGGKLFNNNTIQGTKVGVAAVSTTTFAKQLEVQTDSGTEAAMRLYQYGNNWWDIASVAGTTRLGIGDIGGELVSILTGGNVGLGTNAPSQKLEVVGNIKASGSVNASGYQIGSVAGFTGFTTNGVASGFVTNKLYWSGGIVTNVESISF
jgi:hypothetical protein